MPLISRWMIAFGALAAVCAVIGWGTSDPVIRSGLLIGIAMVAAGAAAAQGRTSLRRTGLFIGMFLPLMTAAVCGWRELEYFNQFSAERPRWLAMILLGAMSVGGFLTMLILMKLRTADHVAERGYSVTPLRGAPAAAVKPAEHPEERAEQQQ